ncbi:MAG: ABC transporter permease, partial [Actinomycetota bacterium]|nr:ABC transporter permease [Actinomycetota bacterium]
MTSAATTTPAGTIQLATVKVRHLKLAVTLGIATLLLAALFFFVPRDGISTFRLGDPAASISLPNVSVPTAATCWIVLAILVLLTAWAFWDAVAYRRTGIWLPIVFGVLAIFAFLVWAAADGLVPVTGLLFGALSLS